MSALLRQFFMDSAERNGRAALVFILDEQTGQVIIDSTGLTDANVEELIPAVEDALIQLRTMLDAEG